MYRTYKDLEQVVQQDKPLRVIKIVFEDYQKGTIYESFVTLLKEQYEEKYGSCEDCLVYVDVIKKPVLDEFGVPVIDETTGEPKTELVYVYEDSAYAIGEDGQPVVDEQGNKQLNDEAAEKLAAGQVKPDFNKWIEWHINGKEELGLEPFVPECINCDEKFVSFIKPHLLDKLAKLADEKQDQAEALIADKKNVSDKQLQRYQTKYELAQQAKANKDYSAFDLEAKLIGMKSEDLVNLILTNGENWKKAIDSFIVMIEAYRVRAKQIIESTQTVEQVFAIEELFKVAATMGPNTSADEIEALFTKYSEA